MIEFGRGVKFGRIWGDFGAPKTPEIGGFAARRASCKSGKFAQTGKNPVCAFSAKSRPKSDWWGSSARDRPIGARAHFRPPRPIFAIFEKKVDFGSNLGSGGGVLGTPKRVKNHDFWSILTKFRQLFL